jgi:predicted ATPase
LEFPRTIASTTDSDRFFVITGGPGAGKTTLLRALADRGYSHIPEAGRAIIRDQVAQGGAALPWSDRAAFARLMLERDMESHRAALDMNGPVIFDRGIPDIIGYLRLSGLPVTAQAEAAAHACRYNRRIFIAPPWPEIFQRDAERKQSHEEAEQTYQVMVETYTLLGYELLTLPRKSVGERVQFVVERLSSSPLF